MFVDFLFFSFLSLSLSFHTFSTFRITFHSVWLTKKCRRDANLKLELFFSCVLSHSQFVNRNVYKQIRNNFFFLKYVDRKQFHILDLHLFAANFDWNNRRNENKSTWFKANKFNMIFCDLFNKNSLFICYVVIAGNRKC